jgi:hypothetical protein
MRFYIEQIDDFSYFLEVYAEQSFITDEVKKIMTSVGHNFVINVKLNYKIAKMGEKEIWNGTKIIMSCFLGVIDLREVNKIFKANNFIKESKRLAIYCR